MSSPEPRRWSFTTVERALRPAQDFNAARMSKYSCRRGKLAPAVTSFWWIATGPGIGGTAQNASLPITADS